MNSWKRYDNNSERYQTLINDREELENEADKSVQLQALYDMVELEFQNELEKKERRRQRQKIDLDKIEEYNYIGADVIHIYSGEGVIMSIDDKYISIKFKKSGKTALYPISCCKGDHPVILLGTED